MPGKSESDATISALPCVPDVHQTESSKVVFRGNRSRTTGLARTDVPQLELVEVA
ncbi:MAG TPA: hypothetical protein VGV35_04635 [Bryobacteraceae bacterium]|nr:hypothetical protein [Bryobacteraceae bacterium]